MSVSRWKCQLSKSLNHTASKNRTASVLAVAGLLGRLQSCGPCVFWFILTLLLSELQRSLLGYQGVSLTSMQILALRKLKTWILIGVLEAIFSTTTMKGLCSVHGMERILPYTFVYLPWAITSKAPVKRTYKWFYKLTVPCWGTSSGPDSAKEIAKAEGGIWGGKSHSCSKASAKRNIFPVSSVVKALHLGIVYWEMEGRMRTFISCLK